MWCVHKDKVCIMVWDIEKGKYVYIPEKKWNRIKKEEKYKKYQMVHWRENTAYENALFLA